MGNTVAPSGYNSSSGRLPGQGVDPSAPPSVALPGAGVTSQNSPKVALPGTGPLPPPPVLPEFWDSLATLSSVVFEVYQKDPVRAQEILDFAKQKRAEILANKVPQV